MNDFHSNSLADQKAMRLFLVVSLCLTIFMLLSSLTSHAESANAVITPEQPSGISGVVWIDLNHNQQLDEDELPAADETIFITPNVESDFAQILVLLSDQQGRFGAANLAAGNYRIWTASQNASDALVINVTDDRAIMTVELALAGHMLYLPLVSN